MKTKTAPTTRLLLAAGWTRDNGPANIQRTCGASGDTTGFCERPARWMHPSYSPMCAQHAASAQRWRDLRS